jgi:hypothetical protein
MGDTLTLALHGDVALIDFETAVRHLSRLVAALTAEEKVEGVLWRIDDLAYGSAVTTIRGIPENGTKPEEIERVVRAYIEVGQALEQGVTIPYPKAVQREARGLAGLIRDAGIEAVRFETAESDAIIRETSQHALLPTEQPGETQAYGAVTGRVQTLTSRNNLRFTLYDHINDRAVSCYLVEGGESLMRQMWDRVATVEGWVSRDPQTGRPMAVRRVSNVTALTGVEPQDYIKARGAIPRSDDEPLPEVFTRRLRDAG